MLRTHYDSLKITRDAPLEVVRAAYRALTLKYHPDRHDSDPQANERMAELNNAYDVLSDPDKRREYDEWIQFVESRPVRERTDSAATAPRADWLGSTDAGERPGTSWVYGMTRFRHYWVFYLLALIAIFVGSLWYESIYLHRSKALMPLASKLSAAMREKQVMPQMPSPFINPPIRTPSAAPAKPKETAPAEADDTPPAETAPKNATRSSEPPSPNTQANASRGSASAQRQATPRPKKPASRSGEGYTRPGVAPNGEPWPSGSDYLAGYYQRNTDGLSQVVLDNSRSASDAFVKIVSVSDNEPKVVRMVFMQANDRFTVNNLRAGTYEIRYQNLDSGELMRSDVFALEESAISSGTRFSTVTLSLRGKPDESQNTYRLSPEDF
jgi:hypothetical protein